MVIAAEEQRKSKEEKVTKGDLCSIGGLRYLVIAWCEHCSKQGHFEHDCFKKHPELEPSKESITKDMPVRTQLRVSAPSVVSSNPASKDFKGTEKASSSPNREESADQQVELSLVGDETVVSTAIAELSRHFEVLATQGRPHGLGAHAGRAPIRSPSFQQSSLSRPTTTLPATQNMPSNNRMEPRSSRSIQKNQTRATITGAQLDHKKHPNSRRAVREAGKSIIHRTNKLQESGRGITRPGLFDGRDVSGGAYHGRGSSTQRHKKGDSNVSAHLESLPAAGTHTPGRGQSAAPENDSTGSDTHLTRLKLMLANGRDVRSQRQYVSFPQQRTGWMKDNGQEAGFNNGPQGRDDGLDLVDLSP